MKLSGDLKIRTRISLGFGILLIILLVMGTVSISILGDVDKFVEIELVNAMKAADGAMESRINYLSLIWSTLEMISTTQGEQYMQARKRGDEGIIEFPITYEILKSSGLIEKKELEKAGATFARLRDTSTRLVSLEKEIRKKMESVDKKTGSIVKLWVENNINASQIVLIWEFVMSVNEFGATLNLQYKTQSEIQAKNIKSYFIANDMLGKELDSMLAGSTQYIQLIEKKIMLMENFSNTAEELDSFFEVFEEGSTEQEGADQYIKRIINKLNRSVVSSRQKLMLLVVIGVLAGIVLSYLISKAISMPVEKLAGTAQLISSETRRAGGKLAHITVAETGPEETVILGRAFNEMMADLQKTYSELETQVHLISQANRELATSNKELEQFAYVASHDLQEPLRKIRTFTELFAKKYKNSLDEKANQYIYYIVDGSYRMQSLISDLLSYSRINTMGKKPEQVSSQKVFERVLENMQTTIEKNHASITCDPLPDVMADETQFEQLFSNLIGNAIKFRKEQPPRIRVAAVKKGENYVFSVSDNGIGLDEQYKEQIFSMFQRLHGANEYEGTGIGLTICKKIVERFDGKIWVESKPEKGATFYFTLKAIV